MFEARRIRCEVQSVVRQEMMPFTAGPLIISLVSIKVLDPEPVTEAQLVLQSRPLGDYDGPEEGEVWKEPGTVLEVSTKYNTHSGRYYLDPEAKSVRNKMR